MTTPVNVELPLDCGEANTPRAAKSTTKQTGKKISARFIFFVSCHEWRTFADASERPVKALHIVFRTASVAPGAPGFV
jgi:hypothetical protein